MAIGITTSAVTVENLEWLASEHAIEAADTQVLDGAKFGAVYTDGVAKSGTVVGVVTASGKYAPHNSGESDGTQTAVGLLAKTITVNGTSGFTDTFGPIMRHGAIRKSKLPRGTSEVGGLSTAAETALGEKIVVRS